MSLRGDGSLPSLLCQASGFRLAGLPGDTSHMDEVAFPEAIIEAVVAEFIVEWWGFSHKSDFGRRFSFG